MEKTIDVIIPTYHPGNEFSKLIDRLMKQTCPIHQIIIMNTEEAFWDSNGMRIILSWRYTIYRNQNLIMVEPEKKQQRYQKQIL